jgi:uncharacterized protein involved in exopolysaccharide biosynthesis
MQNSIPLLLRQEHAEEDADEGLIRRILRSVRRRPLLSFAVFILVLALAVASLVVLRPRYTATALVVVNATQNVLNPSAEHTGPLADTTRIDTEAEILRSDPIYLAAIRSLGLASDPEFRTGFLRRLLASAHLTPPVVDSSAEQLALQRFRRKVSVQRRALTAVIAINVSVDDAREAASIANAIADAYLRQQVQAKVAGIRAARDAISVELGDASADVARSEQAFEDFAEAHAPTIADGTAQANAVALRRQLDELGQRWANLLVSRDLAEEAAARNDWAAVAAAVPAGKVAGILAASPAPAADGGLGGAPQPDTQQPGPAQDSPLADAARADLGTLSADLSTLDAQSSAARRALVDALSTANVPADVTAQAHDLQQRADLARSQYDAMLGSLTDFDTQLALQIPDSRVVAEATVPVDPSFPQPVPFLVLGFFGGIVLAFAAAYAAERMADGFTDELQLASLNLPTAGALPAVGRGGPLSATVSDPRFSAAMSRAAGILDIARARSGRVGASKPALILVCASEPSEGATTVAVALAYQFAGEGRKTLLLVERPEGANVSRLTVLPFPWRNEGADPSVSNVRATLSEAGKSFDVVVCAGAPLGSSADALVIGRASDVVLFVVESRRTRRRTVRASLNALLAAKPPEAEILTLLNKQRASDRLYGMPAKSHG